MTQAQDTPTFVDRTGQRYRSRSGKVWRVTGLTPFGWHLWPDWPGAHVGTAGGTKTLLRSSEDLDDPRKWTPASGRFPR